MSVFSKFIPETIKKVMGYKWKRVMSGKEVVQMLTKNDWIIISQRGSHVKLRKGIQIIIVPLHKELKTGTLNSIKKNVS